jgi:uncharacterized membrane protein
MELHEALSWLMGAGAGIVAFAIIHFAERSQAGWMSAIRQWLLELQPSNKRWLAFALSAAIAIGAYMIAMAMDYVPAPEAWRAWVEELFRVGALAIIVATGMHGGIDLNRSK